MLVPVGGTDFQKNPEKVGPKPANLGDFEAVHPRGLEPLTFGSVDRCTALV